MDDPTRLMAERDRAISLASAFKEQLEKLEARRAELEEQLKQIQEVSRYKAGND